MLTQFFCSKVWFHSNCDLHRARERSRLRQSGYTLENGHPHQGGGHVPETGGWTVEGRGRNSEAKKSRTSATSTAADGEHLSTWSQENGGRPKDEVIMRYIVLIQNGLNFWISKIVIIWFFSLASNFTKQVLYFSVIWKRRWVKRKSPNWRLPTKSFK